MPIVDQNEIDRMLFALQLECARPSLRFRLLFNEAERNLLGAAFSTLSGQRQYNGMINELERRYGPKRGRNAGAHSQEVAATQKVCSETSRGPLGLD